MDAMMDARQSGVYAASAAPAASAATTAAAPAPRSGGTAAAPAATPHLHRRHRLRRVARTPEGRPASTAHGRRPATRPAADATGLGSQAPYALSCQMPQMSMRGCRRQRSQGAMARERRSPRPGAARDRATDHGAERDPAPIATTISTAGAPWLSVTGQPCWRGSAPWPRRTPVAQRSVGVKRRGALEPVDRASSMSSAGASAGGRRRAGEPPAGRRGPATPNEFGANSTRSCSVKRWSRTGRRAVVAGRLGHPTARKQGPMIQNSTPGQNPHSRPATGGLSPN